jgi:murein DD-endopeptidase MepM/ murein hydrolase activator NlpD
MTSPTWGRISQRFHLWHTALDITNSYRTPIKAPEAGKVTFVGQMGSGTSNAGLVVQIGDPSGNGHRLCHLDSFIVKTGQSVTQGQVVGYMGYTGFTIPAGIKGTHLHWVMFRGGKRVDPLNYVSVPTGPDPIPAKMPAVGATINITKGTTRGTFRAGTTTVAGTIKATDNTFNYLVRGYDPKYPNRILINSASAGGNGVALALYYTNGTRIEGWTIK